LTQRRVAPRAAELFAIDEWGSDSGFVEKAWRSHSEPEPAFMSIAASRWHIVVTTQSDVTQLTLRGPETRATVTPIPADTEFFGIVFTLGTFMPAVPLARLVDRAVTLPARRRARSGSTAPAGRSLLPATPTFSSIGWSARA
jgi:hypothetical protein